MNHGGTEGTEIILKSVTEKIIGAAIAVHREMGPGLLESVYEECLAIEFQRSGIKFAQQVVLPIEYRGQKIDGSFRLDFLVEDEVVVELKSVDRLLPIHQAQVLT